MRYDVDVEDLLDGVEELTEDDVERVTEDERELLSLSEGELLLERGGMCRLMSKKYQSFSDIEVTGKLKPLIKCAGRPSSLAL